jgi:PAS domain S-box-containing protein
MSLFPDLFDGQYDYLLREVLESIDDAVLVFDQDCKVIYVNPYATKAFGKSIDQLTGTNIDLLVPTEHRSQFDQTIEALKASSHHEVELRDETEFIGLRGQGHPFYAAGKLAKLKGDLSYILVLRDITWKKVLETELEKALVHLKDVEGKVGNRIEYPRLLSEFPPD